MTSESPRLLHRLFEAQVARAPDATAVSDSRAHLDYRHLNRKANRLAGYLREVGVGPDVIVGLHLARSIDFVAAMLAVSKAGGAYLPLDPEYPSDRLRHMVRDSGAPLVVSETSVPEGVVPSSIDVLLLDEASSTIATYPADDLPDAAGSDDLLYLIYTSGSTGTPKGVLVEHGTVADMFAGVFSRLPIGPGERWSHLHSTSFGFSVWEIWGALLTGGRVVIVPDTVGLGGHDLIDLLRREEVSVLSQTPSGFRILSEAALSGADPADLLLRHIVFSGEELDPALLGRWIDAYGDERPELTNMYALTETGGEVAIRRLAASDVGSTTRSLGHPLPHAKVVLLNPDLGVVPEGDVGELFIGGAAVARGYHNLGEMTRERFVADPTEPPKSTARLFRTGDRGRIASDGSIEFLGRADRQLKIRGYRVEPGEVEVVLSRHAAVREAVVIARGDASGERQLVAYWLGGGAPDRDAAPRDLREHIAATLPEYMLPVAYVRLETFPIGPNGKLLRSALPAPRREEFALTAAFAPTTTELEATLVTVWKEALGVDQIGIRDSFTDLGGTSLLSVQVIVRVVRDLGIELSMRSLLLGATVEDLAEIIETVRDSAEVARVHASGDGGPPPPDLEFGEI